MTATAAQAQTQTPSPQTDMKKMANAIRALAMDAVQKANSGHPGMPMGMADVATVLTTKFLRFDVTNPTWFNRDRLIHSVGHGSMLVYALAYLTGYEEMTLDQIKNFRQLGAVTAGHPEVHQSVGIEMTTGPLGQGLSSSTGFAMAERMLNARFGELVDHWTYVIASDGDMQEGVTHEACALAGRQKLSRLIVLYDDNNISIDGSTDISFTEDVCKRFEAYGWDTQRIDGHDMAAIEAAIAKARTTDTPSLIACKTKIGFGAPTKEGTSSCHGSPLGDEEIAGARKNLNWDAAPFDIPADILSAWRAVGTAHVEERKAWDAKLASSPQKAELETALKVDRSKDIAPLIAKAKAHFAAEKPKHATRQTSGTTLEFLIPEIREMVGGSADLTGSNNTRVKGYEQGVLPEHGYTGQYVYYGVREHGMAAIMNGMALHGGIIPYSGTFLQFADYSRPAIRLGALMKQRVIHVMTHDSIGLGEDGPTHQPVEHLAALRAIPNLYVFRPCDGIETAECWELALNKTNAPSIMALSRQGMPTVRDNSPDNKSSKGAYILKDSDGEPTVTIFATGSEVELALKAAEELGSGARVVSVPCMDLFFEQDADYIESITCNKSVKIAVEAAIRQGWDALIGAHGTFIGMKSFGESAPSPELYKHFGITAEAIVSAAKAKL
ncbi:MAG: transketolase [Pseudobdellovibrionaceae bacterium]